MKKFIFLLLLIFGVFLTGCLETNNQENCPVCEVCEGTEKEPKTGDEKDTYFTIKFIAISGHNFEEYKYDIMPKIGMPKYNVEKINSYSVKSDAKVLVEEQWETQKIKKGEYGKTPTNFVVTNYRWEKYDVSSEEYGFRLSEILTEFDLSYCFQGFYSDYSCKVLFDFNTTPINNDITVYAKFFMDYKDFKG